MIIQIEVISRQPDEFGYSQIKAEFEKAVNTCETLIKTFNGEPLKLKIKIL
jgi:hypothetical protein